MKFNKNREVTGNGIFVIIWKNICSLQPETGTKRDRVPVRNVPL